MAKFLTINKKDAEGEDAGTSIALLEDIAAVTRGEGSITIYYYNGGSITLGAGEAAEGFPTISDLQTVMDAVQDGAQSKWSDTQIALPALSANIEQVLVQP